jgi:hypothetical protein
MKTGKLKEVGSKVGSSRGSASTSNHAGAHKSAGGPKKNNMISANAALKRYTGRGK